MLYKIILKYQRDNKLVFEKEEGKYEGQNEKEVINNLIQDKYPNERLYFKNWIAQNVILFPI